MRVPLQKHGRRSAWMALALALAVVACDAHDKAPLRAAVAKTRQDLVGGPVAYADIGDFILENDKVRVAILQGGAKGSWGPGVYGGSLVDADIRRDDARFPPGQGRDKIAEVFPFANLLVPAPTQSQVSVLKDGSDGKEATVRVEGKGVFLFEALSVLRSQGQKLGVAFPDIKTRLDFRTDYTLHPGDQFVTMKTWIILEPQVLTEVDSYPDRACSDDSDCGKGALVCKGAGGGKKGKCTCKTLAEQGCADQKCDMAPLSDAYGCVLCGCSATLPMTNAQGEQSVFQAILGDAVIADNPVNKAGVGGGDFVFFGNQTDIFVPGHGFDEEKPIWDALFNGRDTFGHPLTFDFVSAGGDEVSYAYYTKRDDGDKAEPKVLVPVFTSAATAFVTATRNCVNDASDDSTCEKARVFEYTRYLAIGHGDVGSVSDIVWAHRGTPTGSLKGYVRWGQTGQPAKNASVMVMRNPDPAKAWTALADVVAANYAIDAGPGVVDSIDADPGADLQEDGAFAGTLPAGDYLLVAMDANKTVVSAPVAVKVVAGDSHVLAMDLPAPGRIRVEAVDGNGAAVPAKLTVVKLGSDGKPLFRDGGRMPYFGQGRLGIGVQHLGFAMNGKFDVPLAEGTYQVVASHGTEWSVSDQVVTVLAGQDVSIRAGLHRDIDTTGWMSGDFHLHAEPSFDSGMPLSRRVETVAAEGVDYVASTDHDVLSDYAPWVKLFHLDQWLRTVVGSEISTLEIGHYIGFPLQYKGLDIPSHGSVQWYCQPSDRVLQDILTRTGFSPAANAADGKASTIIAHPRDGFLGWLDQAGVNAYSHTRTLSTLEAGNPTLRTVGCDHDAMEVFNGKRFDIIHTATVLEVQTFARCLARIDRSGVGKDGKVDAAVMRAELKNACPELAGRNLANLVQLDGLDTCPDSEDAATCKMRYRMALAQTISADINRRTPEEQDAWMDEPAGNVAGEAKPEEAAANKLKALAALCDFEPGKLDQPLETAVPKEGWNRPCGRRDGVFSDYLRFLEHGLIRGIVGGSDSHGYKQEPGLPRTYFRSATDDPQKLDTKAASEAIRQGKTVPSYGPMIEATLLGKGPGETASAKAGDKLKLHVKIQTASWLGVDRVEVYLNGRVAFSEDLPANAKRIVDYDKDVELTMPARDSHIVVATIGTDPKHLMRPVYLDVPFGELQLARVASIAFASLFSGVPALASAAKGIITPPAQIPDFFPTFPMAIAAAILVDQDGNGKYDAPLPMPAFCSPPCDPKTGEIGDSAWDWQGKKRTCKDLQSDYECLTPENRCGLPVPGVCNIFEEQKKGALRDALGAHSVAP